MSATDASPGQADASAAKMVAFRLPEPLVDELKHAAWLHRTTQTEIVTQALREHLARLPKDGD